jgi:hypothetical protein
MLSGFFLLEDNMTYTQLRTLVLRLRAFNPSASLEQVTAYVNKVNIENGYRAFPNGDIQRAYEYVETSVQPATFTGYYAGMDSTRVC